VSALAMLAWLTKMLSEEGFFFLVSPASAPAELPDKDPSRKAERFYFHGRRLIAGHRFSQQSHLARDVAKGRELLARAAEMGHPLAAVDLSCIINPEGNDCTTIINWTKVPPSLVLLPLLVLPSVKSLSFLLRGGGGLSRRSRSIRRCRRKGTRSHCAILPSVTSLAGACQGSPRKVMCVEPPPCWGSCPGNS